MKLLQIAAVAIVLQTSMAQASKLTILTNQPGAAKAFEIKNFISSIEPFKYLKASELTVEVREVNAQAEGIECHPLVIQYTEEQIRSLKYWSEQNHIKLSHQDIQNYRKGYTISRTLDCNKPVIAAIGARFGADKVMYVMSSMGLGGSGGDIPIVSSDSRKTVAVHEWLHTFGFGDEYAYSREEAPAYCTKSLWPNVAVFKDLPPYFSNSDVVAKHASEIPWLSALGSQLDLVTGQQLGTSNHNVLGIYPAKTCSQIPELKSWKANPGVSIMEGIDFTYIPKTFWPTIFTSLGVSKVRSAKLMKLPERAQALRWTPLPPGTVVVDPGHI